jgi:hypothetical protein
MLGPLFQKYSRHCDTVSCNSKKIRKHREHCAILQWQTFLQTQTKRMLPNCLCHTQALRLWPATQSTYRGRVETGEVYLPSQLERTPHT